MLRDEILEEAHSSRLSIHPGSEKMYRDLRSHFWWPGMKRHIATHVSKCAVCQQVKIEHQKPAGTLQTLPIPIRKWGDITMDFLTALPLTRSHHDAIWVIVDRLTKCAHFLPIRVTDSLEKLAQLYIREIVRLHGVPDSIVSDRDPRFTARFWGAFHKALGTRLHLSTAYHPQTDGQSERVIQIVEDMLRSCTLDFGGDWDQQLPLVEFSYNNSFQSTIGMAPYEALYGRRCMTPHCWTDSSDRIELGPELIEETTAKIRLIQARIKTANDRTTAYANRRRRDLEFEVGDKVWLKVAPIRGTVRFGKKGKLSPRYIGPYEILERVGKVAYRLALPPNLSAVHNVFHVSMLKKCILDPIQTVPVEEVHLEPDLSYQEVPVTLLDRDVRKLRNKLIPMVKVQWSHHTDREATWETEKDIQDRYPDQYQRLKGLLEDQEF